MGREHSTALGGQRQAQTLLHHSNTRSPLSLELSSSSDLCGEAELLFPTPGLQQARDPNVNFFVVLGINLGPVYTDQVFTTESHPNPWITFEKHRGIHQTWVYSNSSVRQAFLLRGAAPSRMPTHFLHKGLCVGHSGLSLACALAGLLPTRSRHIRRTRS